MTTVPESMRSPRDGIPRPPARAGTPGLNIRTRLAIRLGSLVLHVLGWTWRVQVFGREDLLARRAANPRVVFTLWHGQMLPILWVHRQAAGVLISEHRDGEIIAHVVARFGFFSIRGSTTRGGARALLECVNVLRTGADVAVTPDGPRGPRHQFAPGALVIAYRAGASVVPIAAHVDRAWRLRSWDAFEIPKPFARIAVVYGPPMPVEAADVRDVVDRAGDFAAALHATMAAAESHVSSAARGSRTSRTAGTV